MMETYERMRELRKKHLHLSQTEFGERLGVSRSVIKNIELNALARPDQKLSLYKLICSEFNVSEKWLLDGTGPMYVEPDTFNLDDFVHSHNATDFELEIIKTYFELDPEIRQAVISHFKKRLSGSGGSAADDIPDTPEELEAQYPPVKKDDTGKDVG